MREKAYDREIVEKAKHFLSSIIALDQEVDLLKGPKRNAEWQKMTTEKTKNLNFQD